MARPLIVTDSETKEKTIKAQYEGDIETVFFSSLPLRVKSVPPEDELKRQKPEFKFLVQDHGKEILDHLADQAGRDMYLSLDSDWHGEYVCWMLTEYLTSNSQGRIVPRRLNLLGLGREELEESFRLIEPMQTDEAISYHLQKLFDTTLVKHLKRLIGTRLGPGGLPLNIRSLNTLFTLYDREAEIATYTPELKWQIIVNLNGPGGRFKARLEEAYGITDDGYLASGDESKKAVNLFKTEQFIVTAVEKSGFNLAAPAPFTAPELVQEAMVLYKITPRQAFDALHKMFCGVEKDGTFTGLVSTYVSVRNISTAILAEKAGKQAAEEFGIEMSDNAAAGADGEGVYIYPLHPELTADDLQNVLSEKEGKIYDLIRNRALASTMIAAAGENITVTIKAGEKCTFQTKMKSLREPGFTKCYLSYHDRDLQNPCPLAGLEEGENLETVQIVPEQTSGFPPEYLTIATLFAELADFKMDMDHENIDLLQSLLDGRYIKINHDGYVRCQENVEKVITAVNKAFPSMQGINLTAFVDQLQEEATTGRKPLDFALLQLEQTLVMQGKVLVKATMPTRITGYQRAVSKKIIKGDIPAAGEGKVPDALMDFQKPSGNAEDIPDRPTLSGAETAEEQARPAAVGAQKDAAAGREDDAVAIETEAVTPEFLPEEAEEEWPDEIKEVFSPAVAEGGNDTAVMLSASEVAQKKDSEQPVIHEDECKPCPACGKDMILKEDRYGKYWSCSDLPACRHSESYKQDGVAGIACPLCRVGRIIGKQTPTGKNFYVCPEHNCEFMAWSRPHAVCCQVCDSPFLVEKKRGGGIVLKCPRAGCNYMQPLPGQEGLVDAAPATGKKKVRVRRAAKGTGGGRKRKVRIVKRK